MCTKAIVSNENFTILGEIRLVKCIKMRFTIPSTVLSTKRGQSVDRFVDRASVNSFVNKIGLIC